MIPNFKDPENAIYSNFFPCEIKYDNMFFQNAEGAYQAGKFVDREIKKEFMELPGGQAKALAKKYNTFKRSDWHDINRGHMSGVLHAKFTQHKDLRIQLINTYPQEMVEGNWWHDNFWGVCTCGKTPGCDGTGKNWLGRMLMAERVYWLDLMANKYKGSGR